jgi:hypothetical protein
VSLLPALDTSTGIVLAQAAGRHEGNEIPAFTPLPNAVEMVVDSLTGVLFVADAMRAQTGHAELITGRGAALLLRAKGNQCATRRSDTLPFQAGQARRSLLGPPTAQTMINTADGDNTGQPQRELGSGWWWVA